VSDRHSGGSAPEHTKCPVCSSIITPGLDTCPFCHCALRPTVPLSQEERQVRALERLSHSLERLCSSADKLTRAIVSLDDAITEATETRLGSTGGALE